MMLRSAQCQGTFAVVCVVYQVIGVSAVGPHLLD
jgi:hypothetical protein